MAEPSALNLLAQALRDPEYYKSVGRGLLDAGNRGIVAGLLGGPVDLTTMALRPLGYTVPTPIGGSEWIGNKLQQYGMVSPQRNALAEALAGFVDPATMHTGALKMAGLLGGLKQIRTEQQLAEAIANGEGQFVRWSRGPTLDKKRGGSRDYLAGSEHGAFSAVPVNPEWATDPAWMTRRVGEYGFLRMKDPDISPYLYSGKKVGTDSDGYDLISNIDGVAKISPSLLDDMAKRYGR